MRNNGSVTGRENHLSRAQSLMSTTDLKGRITHCNAAFEAARAGEQATKAAAAIADTASVELFRT